MPAQPPPLRSNLFIAGHTLETGVRLEAYGADMITFDLEDMVPPWQKDGARAAVRRTVHGLRSDDVLVGVRTSADIEADLDGVPLARLFCIVWPKAEDVSGLDYLDTTLGALEQRAQLPSGHLKVILTLETARGILNAQSLAAHCPRTFAVLFGPSDFCLDIGVSRSRAGSELAHARAHVILVAASQRLLAIDGGFPDPHDPRGLRREALAMRQLGFKAKLAIDARQVPTINGVFSPTEAEIETAQLIRDRWAKAEDEGSSPCLPDGRYIDAAIAGNARRILALAALDSRRSTLHRGRGASGDTGSP